MLPDNEDNEVDLTAANIKQQKMTGNTDGDDDEAYVDDDDDSSDEDAIERDEPKEKKKKNKTKTTTKKAASKSGKKRYTKPTRSSSALNFALTLRKMHGLIALLSCYLMKLASTHYLDNKLQT